MINNIFFYLTENHIKMFRQMIVCWIDMLESGAPSISPETPYGSRNLAEDIEKTTGSTDLEEIIQFHIESLSALQILLKHGKIEAKEYEYPNKLKDKEEWFNILAKNPETANSEMIKFILTEEHIKLLRSARIEMINFSELFGQEFYDVPGFNCKRPYGDMSFFELDMAEIIGKKVEFDENGQPQFTPGEFQYLEKLHEDMQTAWQVFLLYAEIEPAGFIDKSGYGDWQVQS